MMDKPQNKKRICITGANGFIGKELVKSLSDSEYLIRVLTRKDQKIFPAQVEVVLGDLTKENCPVSEFLKDCDVLIHCAGEIHNEALMDVLHVKGTEKLIDGAIQEYQASGKKIHWVQLSSCGAYGPPKHRTDEERIITETSPVNPVNEYEITKTKSDELLVAACGGGEITFSILRPSNVIGPGMSDQSLPKLVRMVQNGRFFFLGKTGAMTTYVHVKDVVKALVMLSGDEAAKGQIFNLSSDCTLEQLVQYTAEQSKTQVPARRLPAILIRGPLSILAFLLKRWMHVPKLDAFVLRTQYPADKIKKVLKFEFGHPMPEAVEYLMDSKV